MQWGHVPTYDKYILCGYMWGYIIYIMARPLRIDVANGWYHVSARGIEQRRIYWGAGYCRHFIHLLESMSRRYCVEVHAYCLMPNHYHLIVRTPEANVSRAIQWLNVSYAAWFNAKRARIGHVFRGRFHSVLIENDGAWLLAASEYLHLNPVRTVDMGLCKRNVIVERRGYSGPSCKEIARRLKKLREFTWSSFPAYAGYTRKPQWLQTATLLARARGRENYRRRVEAYLTGGLDPKAFDCLRGRVVLGTEAFKNRVRSYITRTTEEQPDRKFVKSLVGFDRIVEVVEKEKGESWDIFHDRHGDEGRDLVFYLARMRSGLTNAEIGMQAGNIGYKAVEKAVERFARKVDLDQGRRQVVVRCLAKLSDVGT